MAKLSKKLRNILMPEGISFITPNQVHNILDDSVKTASRSYLYQKVFHKFGMGKNKNNTSNKQPPDEEHIKAIKAEKLAQERARTAQHQARATELSNRASASVHQEPILKSRADSAKHRAAASEHGITVAASKAQKAQDDISRAHELHDVKIKDAEAKANISQNKAAASEHDVRRAASRAAASEHDVKTAENKSIGSGYVAQRHGHYEKIAKSILDQHLHRTALSAAMTDARLHQLEKQKESDSARLETDKAINALRTTAAKNKANQEKYKAKLLAMRVKKLKDINKENGVVSKTDQSQDTNQDKSNTNTAVVKRAVDIVKTRPTKSSKSTKTSPVSVKKVSDTPVSDNKPVQNKNNNRSSAPAKTPVASDKPVQNKNNNRSSAPAKTPIANAPDKTPVASNKSVQNKNNNRSSAPAKTPVAKAPVKKIVIGDTKNSDRKQADDMFQRARANLKAKVKPIV